MENIPVEGIAVSVSILVSMVIGATELVKRIFDKDYRAVALIVTSVVVAALASVTILDEIGLALGIVIGLSSSGVVTGLQKFGQGTQSSPTTLKRPE